MYLSLCTCKVIFYGCDPGWQVLAIQEMDTAVQIQNIRESCFSHPLILRHDAHVGCQTEDTQQERVQLTTEDEPYTAKC